MSASDLDLIRKALGVDAERPSLALALQRMERLRQAAEDVALAFDAHGQWLYPELRQALGLEP